MIYTALQSVTLLACWAWFGGLWSIAFFGFSPGDLEWWFLVVSACAGLYGLRPNLERAIDTAWLKGVTNSKVLAERAAELRPLKRKIDLLFSAVVIVILLLVSVLYISGVFHAASV